MRHTISILTAACVLALGQAAWAEGMDRESWQRARQAVASMPVADQACVMALLQQWLPQPEAHVSQTRALKLSTVTSASQAMLCQYHRQAMQHHALPQPQWPVQWIKRPVQQVGERPALQLDEAMVQRWIAPLQAAS